MKRTDDDQLFRLLRSITFGIILFVIMGGWVNSLSVSGQENEFEVTNQTIDATIDAKGNTHVRLNYEIDAHDLNQLEISIPTDDQKLSSYRVGIIEQDKTINYFSETSSGVAGSYQMTQNPIEAKVRITYPVVNSKVHYLIEYDLDQAVINYQDGAYFEGAWLPLLDSNKGKNTNITLNLSFAGQLKEENISYWLHDTQVNHFEYKNEEGITLLVMKLSSKIKENQPISLHAFFPKSVTPNNPNQIDIKGKQSIQTKEKNIQQKLAEQTKQRDYHLLMRTGLAILVPFLGTMIIYQKYKQIKKNKKAPIVEKTKLGKLPEPIESCLINSLVYQQEPGPNELAASILELGRKGYIKLLPVRMSTRSHSRVRSGFTLAFRLLEDMPNQTLLPSHERYALQLISLDMGEKKVITLEEIIAKIRQRKQNKKAYQDLWKKYSDAIKVKSVTADYPRRKKKNYLIIFSIIVLIFTLLLAVGITLDLINQDRSQWLIGVLVIIGSHILVQLGLAFLLIREYLYRKSTNQQVAIWDSFKSDLRTINRIDLKQFADIDQWEKLLIYAVSLDEIATIQQAFTHCFDMMDLEKNSRSQNADFYRVHGSVANILQPAIKEWIELIDPKGRWLRKISETD
ncbi:DUF2207 family protein [Facklamia miroungae]|uniref:Predicted membrane protein n=1 Tax=Facklamia miroungae TaxID=120956 RepID=A0A1G7S1P9_9LACT|nr:DUF2207 domain-containing protein [Facklamia miroungae]NKZ29194.1 DUF2207 domain-containing protein [Facklamia miroungae]SDG16938.1 Predicted membrane protein [Facklamia miroungae]